MLQYLEIEKTDVVLDAGCGEGFYAMVFNTLYGCKICAVDNDASILKMAKSWLKNEGNIEFNQGDLSNIEYLDNYFDKVVCSEVLEHITEIREPYARFFVSPSRVGH